MPMDWTPQAEAKLIAAIFQVCDIKISSAEYAALAKIMGPECTPKAITHRVTKLKLAGAEDSGVEMAKKVTKKKKKGRVAAPAAKAGESPPKVNSSKKRTFQGKMKNDAGEVLLDGKEIEFGEEVGEGFRKMRAMVEEDQEDDDGLL
ncbi:uncharacterized protein MYCFIDRAFT_83566 [Pseudocercospora fijiensis CIRAD86]|uniref:Uncharacterized protein n=1 Tax=Pseudocercospora fijiensis (strain CIRAD86) TaxID=383855 RepID=M2ZT46_PSEFD|nr:uncharacterized protein MYCFIDRAFT_83566 [Pseudocercospora fijiensis CIRAD86]EME82184.1 hypothetical protein MYCFIDRAFT_83566 [Pseudocercospora fijiensis CIRAD86]